MEGQQVASQKGVNGGALHVFPLEVWERILEAMDDSSDIFNLLSAFPELKSLVSRGKKFDLLIGQVMPLLLPRILEDIHWPPLSQHLKFRLVSKRWRRAVDTCLESQHSRQSYTASRIIRQGVTLDHRFTSPTRPRISTNFRKFIDSGFATVDHNPFPGRSVAVCVNPGGTSHPDFYVNLSEAVPYFQKFGTHVWYLFVDTYFADRIEHGRIMIEWLHPLLRCLSFLPNLKSLKIDGYLSSSRGENKVKQPSLATLGDLPVLPFKLESLDVSGLSFHDFPELVHLLIRTCVTHDRIQKLCVHPVMLNPPMCESLFPHMTDLEIILRNADHLDQAMSSILTPRIRKLNLDLSIDWRGESVARTLERFQPYQLECLVLDAPHCMEETALDPQVPLPTIKNLSLYMWNGIHFRFLRSLPSLEYLSIDINPYRLEPVDFVIPEEDEGNEFHEFDVAIRNLCNDDGTGFRLDGWDKFESIWALLPRLKMLTVEGEHLRQYFREVRDKFFEEPLWFH